jgi:hypothetical protein
MPANIACGSAAGRIGGIAAESSGKVTRRSGDSLERTEIKLTAGAHLSHTRIGASSKSITRQ